MAINQTDPQTLARALHGSPVGLAAWIPLRRHSWSDRGGEVEDTLPTYLSLYWFTNTFVSSALLPSFRLSQTYGVGQQCQAEDHRT